MANYAYWLYSLPSVLSFTAESMDHVEIEYLCFSCRIEDDHEDNLGIVVSRTPRTQAQMASILPRTVTLHRPADPLRETRRELMNSELFYEIGMSMI